MEIKTFITIKSLFLGIFLLSTGVVQSQEYYAIEVIGYVKQENNRKLKDTKVTLRSQSKKPDTVIVAEDGVFTLFLEYDKDYTIEMSGKGYVSKKIAFSTKKVPEKDKKEAHGFEFEISLFKEIEGFDASVFNKPVAKVIYNQRKRYFDYDDAYTEQQQMKSHKAFKKQMKYMKQKLIKETLKRDSMISEIEQIKASTALSVEHIIDSAMQQADSILSSARVTSNISSLITLYDTIIKRTGSSEMDIQEPEVDITLSEFESKTMKEIQIMLKDTNELIKRKREIQIAKKQLEEDRLNATTKTDILLINEREARIDAEEIKILLVSTKAEALRAEKEGDNYKTNQYLIWALSLICVLFVWLLYKYRLLKQKTAHSS